MLMGGLDNEGALLAEPLFQATEVADARLLQADL
jgi:hypothetical protein